MSHPRDEAKIVDTLLNDTSVMTGTRTHTLLIKILANNDEHLSEKDLKLCMVEVIDNLR